MLGNTSGLTQISKTWVDDNADTVTDLPLIFSSVDIQVLTNPAYFGTRNQQEFYLDAGDVVSYRNQTQGVDIQQFFFKNAGAGNNITVVVNGVLL